MLFDDLRFMTFVISRTNDLFRHCSQYLIRMCQLFPCRGYFWLPEFGAFSPDKTLLVLFGHGQITFLGSK
jgi:hypothetical protein